MITTKCDREGKITWRHQKQLKANWRKCMEWVVM
jgi:hypothetical protein